MKNLPANIRNLYIFSFLQMMLFPMAIITLFWKDHIGLTLTQILLLQGIFSVATLALDYPAGYVSDRVGYRCALNIAAALGIAGWAIYIWADSFATVLLAEIVLGMSLSFVSGSDSALLFETLREQGDEQSYARHQGRMHGFAQVGEATGAVLAGVIYAWDARLPFILQVAVWALGLFITRQLVETPRAHAPARSHLAEALATARYAFGENRHLRYTILVNTVLGIASFYPVWLIQPYMQHAKVPLGWFGPVWAGANLTVALCALASHRLYQRLGDRGMILFFLALVAAGYLGLGLSAGIWGFLFYYLLTCMRGLRGPMMLTHTQRESTSANRAATLSLQSVSFRLLFVVTGPLAGKLADKVGVQDCFYLLFYGFLVTLPLLAFLFLKNVPRTPPQPS
ncbi:MFS transporter [Geomonas silvestris]|uniref:MFS transporter n=1 Tax=Geomonas silvestris TaxID=2740184 RepID=A0A6V8MKN0_9BACT|nr:MFS transporter [Geomonas silvestris]GFO60595.1 MFS transporter [Geomonas silvestris]